MTSSELREVQHFLEEIKNPGTYHFIDNMSVMEAIVCWLKDEYQEQGPSKLGDEYKEL